MIKLKEPIDSKRLNTWTNLTNWNTLKTLIPPNTVYCYRDIQKKKIPIQENIECN